MQARTLDLTQKASGMAGKNRLVVALITAMAMLLTVLVPSQSASAADVALTATSVSSISPSVGVGSGNTLVTLTGTNLTGTTAVQFGSSNGSFVTNVSSSSVTVRTPTGVGTVDVKITTPLGTVTVKNGFTFGAFNVSTVASVSPTSGLAAGYNTVTLTGTNLRATTGVNFGNVPAVSFTIISDTQVSAVVPAGVASSNAVSVTATNASGLYYGAAFYKYSSSACATKTYSITTFKNRSALLTTAQKTAIRRSVNVLIASGCDQVNLVRYVGTTKGASASFKSYLSLSIKRAAAVNAVILDQLETRGKSLKVKVIGRTNQISQAKKAIWDSYTSYRKVLLTINRPDSTVDIYPSAGSVVGGTQVFITGTGFKAVAATGAVKFGNIASLAYTVNAAGDTITATVPAGLAGTAPVTVQLGVVGTAGAKLLSGSYLYLSAPTVTAVSPPSGPTGGASTVTLTGTGFSGVRGITGVKFGGVNAASYSVTPTSITAVTPANSVGATSITITSAGGSATIGYTYVAAPTVTSLSKTNGSTAGGTALTIKGTGFTGASAASILFGTSQPTSVTVNSAGTEISATTPARTAGKVNLTIAASGGTIVVNQAYEYGMSLNPTFAAPVATAGGFTVQVTNFDALYVWPTPTTTVGTAAINGTGLITVTGLLPGQPSTITATTTRTGFTSGTASVTSNALATPTFSAPTRTADGFTVVISNYASYVSDYTWSPPSATGVSAAVVRSGATLTVTGIATADTPSTVTISVSRTNFLTGTGTVTASSLATVLTPEFGAAIRTADGFTVQVTNYDAAYVWATSETAGSSSISGSGLITVTGLSPDESSTVTATTTRVGYVVGTATATASSLAAALSPTFGEVTRTIDGFTVEVTNYDPNFGWSTSATAGSSSISGSGLLTLAGLGSGEPSEVTVTTTRSGYVGGSATISDSSGR